MSLLGAAALGKYVIASDVSGISDYISKLKSDRPDFLRIEKDEPKPKKKSKEIKKSNTKTKKSNKIISD